MTNGLQVVKFESDTLLAMGRRPIIVNGGWPQIVHPRNPNLRFNSLLSHEEWKRMDETIIQAARLRLRGVQDLMSRNLTTPLGGLGTMVSQWGTVSEMSGPKVTMSGRATSDRDRVEFGIAGVPVPIIHKEYEIGTRELEASRLSGDALDTSNGGAAARVVMEQEEDMLFNGYAITFDGKTIYGYTTHPNRIADTATNFGGGDWGTITNPLPTVAGMINQLKANRFYGPYGVYVARQQFHEASTVYITDGSGQRPLDRIQALPGVEFVEESDYLAAGSIVVFQLTSDVIDWAYIPGFMPSNVEWQSGDGMINHFKVMSVGVPRIKTPQGTGKTGIAHATGA